MHAVILSCGGGRPASSNRWTYRRDASADSFGLIRSLWGPFRPLGAKHVYSGDFGLVSQKRLDLGDHGVLRADEPREVDVVHDRSGVLSQEFECESLELDKSVQRGWQAGGLVAQEEPELACEDRSWIAGQENDLRMREQHS